MGTSRRLSKSVNETGSPLAFVVLGGVAAGFALPPPILGIENLGSGAAYAPSDAKVTAIKRRKMFVPENLSMVSNALVGFHKSLDWFGSEERFFFRQNVTIQKETFNECDKNIFGINEGTCVLFSGL